MQRPVDAGGNTDDSKWSADMKTYEAQRHALFFTDPDARKMYKNHVTYLVNRVNAINGYVR